MTSNIITVADGFWNIRGSFRIKGLIDVGTQVSLVRLASGKFVFLDSYSLDRAAMREVAKLTGGVENVAAILNVHPFHTMHVERMHELFPQAALHGTARHRSRFPSLPWSKANCEDRALHRRYAADFEFSVPRGVDFISADENVHFSSVLVFHPESSTLHVDDTLVYLRLPGPLRALGLGDSVSFHPTLASALEPRAGAAADFHDWASELIERWRGAENLCAAHTAALLARDNRGAPLHERLLEALDKAGKTLERHRRKYG